MKHWMYGIMGLTFVSLFSGCRTTRTSPLTDPVNREQTTGIHQQGGDQQISSPLVYVYKTKADYSALVPVIMNEARTKIVSYPAPRDVIAGDKLAIPVLLEDSFWLDNRGISPNVAFLTYTYEAYSKLTTVPDTEQLMQHIADRYPLTELYECGRRADYTNLVEQLNRLIKDGFPGCKKVKIIGPVLLDRSK